MLAMAVIPQAHETLVEGGPIWTNIMLGERLFLKPTDASGSELRVNDMADTNPYDYLEFRTTIAFILSDII